jgi:hypothetical protein
MATATKKRPAFLTEPGEAKEAPADEVREGGEADDAPKVSRKRSAKGARQTKAPMDAECGCGNKGRKGKAACDGSCGKAMKDGSYAMKGRNDALTPQEYLAACDLGIQGRSRTYIRARLDTAMNLTPSTLRTDLKCGKGSISKGEKCTKGAATAVEKPLPSIREGARVGAKYGSRINAAVGAAQGAIGGGMIAGPGGALGGAVIGAAGGYIGGAIQGALLGAGVNAARKTGAAYGRSRERNRKVQAGIAKLNPKFKKQYAAAKAKGASRQELTQLSIKQAGEIDKLMNKVNKRRDSVYASGFTLDTSSLAI